MAEPPKPPSPDDDEPRESFTDGDRDFPMPDESRSWITGRKRKVSVLRVDPDTLPKSATKPEPPSEQTDTEKATEAANDALTERNEQSPAIQKAIADEVRSEVFRSRPPDRDLVSDLLDDINWRRREKLLEKVLARENQQAYRTPIEMLKSSKPPEPEHHSPIRAVLGFLRKWTALGGVFLIGATWTMIQIDEYALAAVLLVIGMFAFSIQIYDWSGIENHRKATHMLKGVAVFLAVGSLAFFGAVIIKKKGVKPWTNLLTQETRPVKQSAATPSQPTPEENEVEGNVFLSEKYPAIGKTKTFTFFGIKNYGVVTIQARFGLSSNFTIILLVHSIEEEPGIATGDCLTAIKNYQAIVDDLKAEAKKRSPEFVDFDIDTNLICHYDYATDISPAASEALKRIALRKNLGLSIEGPRGPK